MDRGRRTRAGVRKLRCGLALAWLVATLSLAAPMAEAQEMSASLEELLQSGRLKPGDAVHVTDTLGLHMNGHIVDLSSSTLVIAAGRHSRTFTEDEVSTITLRDSVSNGIWLGAAAGVGTFFGLCTQGRVAECVVFLHNAALIWAGIGAFVGWSIDYSIRETVYRRPRSARLTVSPVVTHEGAGAGMTLSW